MHVSDMKAKRKMARRRAPETPRPLEHSLTIHIDADVLAWLKAQGPGYRTRINRLLRAAMERSAGNYRDY